LPVAAGQPRSPARLAGRGRTVRAWPAVPAGHGAGAPACGLQSPAGPRDAPGQV